MLLNAFLLLISSFNLNSAFKLTNIRLANIESHGLMLNGGEINFSRTRYFIYQIFNQYKVGLLQEQKLTYIKQRKFKKKEIRKYGPNNSTYITTYNLFTCFFN